MIVKEHTAQGKYLLAICDENLLDTTIKFKDVVIEVSDFYRGEIKETQKVMELLKNVDIVNALGKETINFLIKNNFIEEDNVIHLGDVPHAQMFKITDV